MAGSSTHTRKRQYQPSNQTRLTSFFGDARTSVQQPAMSPELPPDVAASLLSVGMRVRKSVPEGYKNKAPDTIGFPFPSSAPPPAGDPTLPVVSTRQTRELMPFCGLHKTAGWAVQEVPSSSAPAAIRASRAQDCVEDMPELSMSQSTITSSQQSFAPSQALPTSKKRIYEEESEAFMDDMFDELDDEATIPQQTAPSRPIARVKASSQKTNTGNTLRIFGSDDFEDATFLVPLDLDVDMDR